LRNLEGPGPYRELKIKRKGEAFTSFKSRNKEGNKVNQAKPTSYTRFCVHWSKGSARLDFTLCDNNIISLKKRFLEVVKLGLIPFKIGSFLTLLQN